MALTSRNRVTILPPIFLERVRNLVRAAGRSVAFLRQAQDRLLGMMLQTGVEASDGQRRVSWITAESPTMLSQQ
jgi:hypothetical protein